MRRRAWIILLVIVVMTDYGRPGRLPKSVAGQEGVPARDEGLIARYKEAVEARPVRGPALDRLCALYDAGPGLDALVAEYRAAAKSAPDRAAFRLILGHLERYRDRPADALVHYREAARLEPASFVAQFSLGEAAAVTGDVPGAERALRAAAAAAATDDQRRAAYERLGEVLARAGRWDEARTAWESFVTLAPDAVDGRLELARALERFGRYAEAIDAYRAITRLPRATAARRVECFREIGLLHERLDQPEKAVEAYLEALDLTAPASWLREHLRQGIAQVCRAAGRLDWLVGEYERRLAVDLPRGERAEWLTALAALEAERLNVEAAADRYRQALDLRPDDAGLRRRFADFLADRGQHAAAAEQLARLVQASPDDANLRFDLAVALAAADKPREAEAVWQEIARRFADNRAVRLRLADAYRQAGRPGESAAVYRALLGTDPGDAEAARSLAVLEQAQGRPDAARAVLKAFVAARPTDVAAHLAAAAAFDELAMPADAAEVYARAAELKPANEQVLRGLALALTAARRYDEALAAWQRARRAASTDFQADQADEQMLGILTLQDRLGPARTEYERALQEQPDNVETGLFLAKIYLRLGDPGSAIATYEKLLDRVPDDLRVRAALAAAYERRSLFARAREAYRALADRDRANRRQHLRAVVTQCLRLDDREGAVAAALSIVAEARRDARAHAELAEVYAHFKDSDRALDAYDQAIALAPDDFTYADAKARILDAVGRGGEAADLYRRVLRTAADPVSLRQAVRELIRLAAGRDDLERLAAGLRDRGERRPREWVWYAMRAEVYRALGDPAAERGVLTDALRQASDRAAALQALMAHHELFGPLATAITYGEELLAQTPRPTAAQYEHLIELLLRAGRVPRADRLARQMLASQPADAPAYRALFVLYAAEGLRAEALKWLAGLLTLTPADVDTRLRLAQIHEDLGEAWQAEAEYRRVLETRAEPAGTAGQPTIPPRAQRRDPDAMRRAYLDPDAAPAADGDASPAAATVFRQYVPVMGRAFARREALYGLIRLARDAGTLPALAAEFRQRRDRDPAGEQAHLDYLAVCQAQHDADAIVAAYQAAAERWDQDAFWPAQLAEAAERLGRWREASQAYERLSDLDAAGRTDHLGAAVRALVAAGDGAALDALIGRRITTPGSDPWLVLAAAQTLYESGDLKRAAALLKPLAEDEGVAWAYGQMIGEMLAGMAGAAESALALKAFLARFRRPEGPGLDEVWPALAARRQAYRRAAPLMEPAERQALYDAVRARAEREPRNRDAQEQLAVLAEEAQDADIRLAALRRLKDAAKGDGNLPYQLIDTLLTRFDRRDEALHLAQELVGAAATPAAKREVCLRLINTYGSHDPGDEAADLIVRTYLGADPLFTDCRTMATVVIRWGRQARGAALLEQALDLSPDDRATAQQLADLYRRMGRLEALHALYDRLVATTPLPPAPEPETASAELYASREALLLPVIEVHRNANRMGDLVKEAERVLAAEPGRPWAAYDLAIIHRHAGRPDLALAVLERLVADAPTDAGAAAALAEALMRAARFERAADLYRRLLRVAPSTSRTIYRRLAECYAQLNRPADRLETLEQLAARFRDADVYAELARLYRQDGQKARAQEAYRQYLEAAGRGAPGSEYERYRQLAQFLASMNDADAALDVLRQGIRRVQLLRDGARQARLLHEDLLTVGAETGRLAAITADLEAQLSERPTDEDLLALLAQAYHRQERFADEVACRRRLADRSPADPDRRRDLAQALVDAGQYDQAVQIWTALARTDPDRAATHLANAAAAYFQWGRNDRAVETWWASANEAFRRDRGTELYRSGQAYYQLAVTFEGRGLVDEAERAYLRALEAAVAPTYDLYGGAVRLLVKRGKTAEALLVAARGLERTGPGPERTSLIHGLLPYGRSNAALLRTMADALAQVPVLKTDADLAVEVHQAIGERFASVGDAGRAAAAFEAALNRRPADRRLKRALADALVAAGRPARAADLYRDILRGSPGDYGIVDALAAALVAQEQTDEAIRLWADFVEREPDNASALRLAGQFFRDHQALDRAAAAFEAAVRADPTNVTNYLSLAEVERRRQDFPAAVKALEAARAHAANDTQRRAIEQALLRVYDQAKMLPGLIASRQEAVARTHAELVRTVLALARALEAEGRAAEARAACERVIELAPESPEADEARRRLRALPR